jgi:hypothetical protein
VLRIALVVLHGLFLLGSGLALGTLAWLGARLMGLTRWLGLTGWKGGGNALADALASGDSGTGGAGGGLAGWGRASASGAVQRALADGVALSRPCAIVGMGEDGEMGEMGETGEGGLSGEEPRHRGHRGHRGHRERLRPGRVIVAPAVARGGAGLDPLSTYFLTNASAIVGVKGVDPRVDALWLRPMSALPLSGDALS